MITRPPKISIFTRRKALHDVYWKGVGSEVGVMGGGCNDQGLFIEAIRGSLCPIVSIDSLYS